jgi:alkanesulfonate monooxygenase SsuD/methylene tetrahydromethanopterin reductase-like flavin-dependent oxidoreductase (luciferase family)
MASIKGFAKAAGRDPSKISISVSTGIGVPISADEVKQFADMGVDQVIIGGFGASAEEYTKIIESNAEALIR